jgi:hypothetical protein
MEDNGLTIGPSLESLSDDNGSFTSDGFYQHNPNPAPTPDPKPADEPKLFAGKYKTAEEMEAAYVALQKKLGAPKPPAETPPAEEPPAETPPSEEAPDEDTPPEDTPAEETPAAEQEKVNIEALTAEYSEKGELSEESLAGLEKLGVTADVAGLFFQGVEAIKTLRSAEITQVAGSAEDMASIVEWGTANMDDASQKAFNDAVDAAVLQGDMAAIKLMIPAIKQQMIGTEPQYVDTKGGQPVNQSGYASREEMSADMRDPRYARDPAFVAQVQNRLRQTTAF